MSQDNEGPIARDGDDGMTEYSRPVVLALYMRSGAIVRIRNVSGIKICYSSSTGRITRLVVRQDISPSEDFVYIESLQLDQIDAIVREAVS